LVTLAGLPEGEDYVLQRLRALRKNESGFTLTELLIVIVILGILTGVVIVAVGAFDDRGQEAACKSDKKSTEVAVEAYRAKTGAYPPNLAVLQPNYLRELPSSTEYTVSYVAATGVVTAELTDGTDC
jgi:prepilin-type N-terminal cleavage/methylation domain-containing protein